ncbi:hypothetical protein G6F44_000637 [Rhizopus delemar]|nr:hypothetical protein G6F44_000637 [Rhizopus delemar]
MSTGATELRLEEITKVLKEQINDIPERQFIPRPLNKLSLDDKRQNLGNSNANLIEIRVGEITANTLTPREQEKENESILQGIEYLLDNQFMYAKAIFEEKADRDPLNALALSSMAFLKAIMTSEEQDYDVALKALNATYTIASAQSGTAKGTSKITSYISNYYNYLRSNKASPSTRPSTDYVPNGALRALVIEAECSLQIAILHLLQESVLGYFKCALNLERAYRSYKCVWQEYQKMGTDYLAFMDKDTVSCLQFGIGSVHLILSLLPAKVLHAISAVGWKPDRQLGFSLLNQCIEDKRIKSSMAAIMLLVFYSTAISFAPRILSETYKKEAMDVLLRAQQSHPDSILYLFFAGMMARLGSDLPLSTQSFMYTAEFSRNEWAQVALTNACRFEIAINHMITGNWHRAANAFDDLYEQNYWSSAFCRYAQGACYEMMGERAQAVILFAEVPKLITKKFAGRLSDVDAYVLRKTSLFQKSGYQNLDFFVPALEFMCLWNLFPFMTHELLQMALKRIDHGLIAIQRCEQLEQEERMKEIATDKPLPDYFNEIASLYVTKSSILNVLGRPEETTLDLNWVLDHGDYITDDTWTAPYALWEAGVACWILGNQDKSQQIWKKAVDYNQRYDFEYRLAVRLSLVMPYEEEKEEEK